MPVPAGERADFPARERVPQTHTFVARGDGGTSSPVDTLTIHAWCDRQDALSVIGRYVQLDRRGMACCPFGWHHSDGKDSHPSLWVHAPTASGGPCWYCNTWRRGGNLFDFLCLWYDVAPREMWRRIQTGEVNRASLNTCSITFYYCTLLSVDLIISASKK